MVCDLICLLYKIKTITHENKRQRQTEKLEDNSTKNKQSQIKQDKNRLVIKIGKLGNKYDGRHQRI